VTQRTGCAGRDPGAACDHPASVGGGSGCRSGGSTRSCAWQESSRGGRPRRLRRRVREGWAPYEPLRTPRQVVRSSSRRLARRSPRHESALQCCGDDRRGVVLLDHPADVCAGRDDRVDLVRHLVGVRQWLRLAGHRARAGRGVVNPRQRAGPRQATHPDRSANPRPGPRPPGAGPGRATRAQPCTPDWQPRTGRTQGDRVQRPARNALLIGGSRRCSAAPPRVPRRQVVLGVERPAVE